jgi:ketosteroid isomerase-like protein/quinol monooxygenase YgiN
MTEKNEELVRAFYKAIPGLREPVCALQAAHTVHEVPEGICTGGERFDGVTDLKHFFEDFCAAFDVYFVAEEFITMDERVVAIGHIQGVDRRGAGSIDVPFVHVWTVRDDRLNQLLFFTDTAMLTQALAEQVGWNARTEAKGDVNMASVALLVRLEAKPGKETEVENFLREGLAVVRNEPGTTAWFAIRVGPSTFGIFDAFPDELGRQAHLSGPVAAALMAKGSELFAQPPAIEKVDVLAAKLPE